MSQRLDHVSYATCDHFRIGNWHALSSLYFFLRVFAGLVPLTMECHTPHPETKERTVYTVIWVILLILVAWPLAWLLAPVWIVLLALEAVFSPGKVL